MEEQKVFIDHGSMRLEGLFGPVEGTSYAAVITHPHPLMGGEMMNPVVETLTGIIHDHGISTLRFNFRGVGKSKGFFDGGLGEQDDVRAALSFVQEKGAKRLLLAGYSFGAWVSSSVLTQHSQLLPAVFVSPPIHLFPFDYPALRGRVGLIISGDHDQFCSLETIRAVADELSCRLEIIPNTDHFFFANREVLARQLWSYLDQVFSENKSL
jgi:uncharacterized protein